MDEISLTWLLAQARRDLNAALGRTLVHGARLGQFILSLSGVEAPPMH